jgi:catechol 2,3-dioxygenase-like lactoylglutathione lyase family enzyme/uncharacterized protein YciI
MVDEEAHRSRPGPRPRRLYVRLVRHGAEGPTGRGSASEARAWLAELDRVGRLVSAGATTDPPGHLLIVRASGLPEARRILRGDPFVALEGDELRLWEWDASSTGSGVNLEPPPARGAGRLTSLNRVAVFVRDQASSLTFYREVLGLAVRDEDPETEFVELALGPGASGIVLVRPRPSWGEPFYSEGLGRIGQRTGIAFKTDSVEALALRLLHAGSVVTQAPRKEPWGGRSIRFTDPDANEFLAYDDGPRKALSGSTKAPKRRHRRKDA